MSLGIGNSSFDVLSGGGDTTPIDATGAKALVLVFGIANAQFPHLFSDNVSNVYTLIKGDVGSNYSLLAYRCISPTTNVALKVTTTPASVAVIVITDSSSVAFDAANGATFFDTTADPGSISVASGGIALSAIASNRSNIFGDYPDPTGYTKLGVANTDTSFTAAIQVDYNLSPGATEQPLWAGSGFQGAVDVFSFKPSGSPPPATRTIRLLASLGVGQ